MFSFAASQFIRQYFSQTDHQGESHPALTLLNQLCTNADKLTLKVTTLSLLRALLQKVKLRLIAT